MECRRTLCYTTIKIQPTITVEADTSGGRQNKYPQAHLHERQTSAGQDDEAAQRGVDTRVDALDALLIAVDKGRGREGLADVLAILVCDDTRGVLTLDDLGADGAGAVAAMHNHALAEQERQVRDEGRAELKRLGGNRKHAELARKVANFARVGVGAKLTIVVGCEQPTLAAVRVTRCRTACRAWVVMA
jgi:hypothetical protein